MSRKTIFAEGEYYHLYNRGTEKRNIFSARADYERFLSLLYACNGAKPTVLKLRGYSLPEVLLAERGDSLVDLCAYVLMPNHFHLLVRAKHDQGISRFLQKLSTAYTMYFNTRYDRNGALFQGTFKATHVDTDRYLKYLISYIHLNPIKIIEPKWKETGIADRANAERYLETYEYSSYLDYMGATRPHRGLINMEAIPAYALSGTFKSMVTEWLNHKVENSKV